MAEHRTAVTLRLPWKDVVSRHRSVKEARIEAEKLAKAWSKGSLGPFEASRDEQGDFVVALREAQI